MERKVDISKKQLPEIGRPFLHEDFLTQEHIKEMAGKIAAVINGRFKKADTSERKKAAIVAGLDFKSIASMLSSREYRMKSDDIWIGDDEYDPTFKDSRSAILDLDYEDVKMPVEDLKKGLEVIRKAVIRELRAQGIDEVYLKKGKLEKEGEEISENTLCELENNLVYKFRKDEHIQEHHTQIESALDKLAADCKDDPHDNIYFGLVRYDVKEGRSIIKKRKFICLHEKIMMDHRAEGEEKIDFHESMQKLIDAMNGAAYLSEKGLVVEDISLQNIGLDEEGGFLFDFDALFEEEEIVKERIYRLGYKIPEVDKGEKVEITPEEMTFQFGICILELIKLFRKFTPDTIPTNVEEIEQYADTQMTRKFPDSRPSIKDAKDKLETMITGAA